MKPLLAHVYEPRRVTYPCHVQPKLNGIRALYQAGRFQSRDEHPFAPGLLEHLAKPLREAFGLEVILDGELYKHGWSLQRINGAVTPVRDEANEDTKEVEYHIFDSVDFTRAFALRRMMVHLDHVKHVETVYVHNEAEANYCYIKWVALGYEGMMYRLGDCPYTIPHQPSGQWPAYNERSRYLSDQDNRCWHLLKRKSWQDEEFKIIGVQEGEGKYEGMLGAITCQTPGAQYDTKDGEVMIDPLPFSVGSGFSDSDRQKYWEFPMLIIGKQAKVKYLCLSEDGIPLNPTILAIL